MAMPQSPAAPLLLIGGGSSARSIDLLRAFVDLAGGSGARIAVITSGSRVPHETGARYERLFGSVDAAVDVCHIMTRGEANEPRLVARLEAAAGYFFTGGEQLNITSRLGGSAALAAIRRRHAAGAPLAGTSAGTSVMSRTMIAFGNEGHTPRHDLVNLAPGLDFLPGVVLDQHFTERRRLGRLITAVSYNPEEIGVGIDEDTAGLFRPDGTLEVLGPGTITVIDALHVQANTSPDVDDMSEPLEIDGLEIHCLVAGARYNLLQRRPAAKRAAA